MNLLMVPVVGLEPTRHRWQRILSPPRLPIPTHRHLYFQRPAPDALSEKSEGHRGGTLKTESILSCQKPLINQGFQAQRHETAL